MKLIYTIFMLWISVFFLWCNTQRTNSSIDQLKAIEAATDDSAYDVIEWELLVNNIPYTDQSSMAPNSISLYLTSNLQNKTLHDSFKHFGFRSLNGFDHIWSKVTEENIIETTYTITQPIETLDFDQAWWDEEPLALEICTPDGCTSLSTWDINRSLLDYFTTNYEDHLWKNYFLVRLFTEENLYQELVTLTYVDFQD